jgi:hypothetical protein
MFYQLVVLYIEDRGHTTNLSTTTLGPPYARSRREASRGTAWSLAPIRVNSAKRECANVTKVILAIQRFSKK